MKFYTGISGNSPSKFELQFSSRTSIRLLYSNLIDIFAACLHPQTTLFLKFHFFLAMFRVTVTSFWRFQDRAIIKSSSGTSIRLLHSKLSKYCIVLYCIYKYCIVIVFQLSKYSKFVFCRDELRLLMYWGGDNWGGMDIWSAKKKEECVSSCREFDVIGVKSKGRGSKTCERFVTHNSQLVNDLEYGDDMHANYFSRHSTSPNHRACIPLLDSRRLRSRECRGVTVRSIQLRWYPFRRHLLMLYKQIFYHRVHTGQILKSDFFKNGSMNCFESSRPSRRSAIGTSHANFNETLHGNSREFLVKIQTLDAISDQTIRDKML